MATHTVDNGSLQFVLDDEGNPVPVSGSAILSAIWNTTAPDPELYSLASIGADTNGVSTSLTYHITGVVGSKAWTATGGTVANLYGA